MSYETIVLERKDGVATLTLNRPEKLNAMNRKMTEELNGAVVEIAKDRDVRALIVTGAGRGFCSGADVGDMTQTATPIDIRYRTQMMHKIFLALTDLEKPVIAKVNGAAVGMGCSLALSADMIIASENAKFSLIFSRIGLIPGCCLLVAAVPSLWFAVALSRHFTSNASKLVSSGALFTYVA